MSGSDAPGVYLLLIRLAAAGTFPLRGKPTPLVPGWYLYAGSGQGGVAARLARHLRTHTVRHWHVDTLLAAGRVRDVQVRVGAPQTAECALARMVRDWPDATPIPGFGASDCACASHLAHFPRRPAISVHAPPILTAFEAMYAELRRLYDDHARRARDPFQTLVACILSLRTQDPVTDVAAARLFAVHRTAAQFAKADPDEVARLVYPVGMYRQKSRALVRIGCEIMERFAGRVPADIDELTTLPMVGRKTANLVRSFAFQLPALCVDTHVHRIANRWGLVRTATPDETEQALRHLLPEALWIETNPFLVQHGQQVCRPLRPRCTCCALQSWCQYAQLCRERQLLDGVPGAPPHPSLRLEPPAPAGESRPGPKMPSPFERSCGG